MSGESHLSIPLWITLVLMGIVELAPWGLFLNNQQYITWKLNNQTTQAWSSTDNNATLHKALQNSSTAEQVLEKYLSMTIFENSDSKLAKYWASTMAVCSLGSFISVIIGSSILDLFSEKLRIYGNLWIMSFIFLITTIFVWIDERPFLFFITTIISLVTIIASAGFLQTSLFAKTGPMNPVFTRTMILGQGLGAVLISAFMILLDKIFKDGESYPSIEAQKYANTVYWVVATFLCLALIALYKLVFEKHVEEELSSTQEVSLNETQEQLIRDEKEDHKELEEKQTDIPFRKIVKFCFPFLLAETINSCITFILYPSLLTKIHDQNAEKDIFGIYSISWNYIHFAVFLMFNVADFLGKTLSSYNICPKNETLLVLFVSCRAVFIYLFMQCDLNGLSTGFLSSNMGFLILNFLFSLTNGYFGSVLFGVCAGAFHQKASIDYTPSAVGSAQGKVASYLVVCLVGGIFLGGLLSYPIVNLANKILDVEVKSHQLEVLQNMLLN